MGLRDIKILTLFRPGDRRRSDRVRTFIPSLATDPRDQRSIGCTVRNLSPTGAKVHLDGEAALPDEFDLELRPYRMTARARVVWRGARYVGVAFVGRPGAKPQGVFEL